MADGLSTSGFCLVFSGWPFSLRKSSFFGGGFALSLFSLVLGCFSFSVPFFSYISYLWCETPLSALTSSASTHDIGLDLVGI